jgi:hypothetical protein
MEIKLSSLSICALPLLSFIDHWPPNPTYLLI